MKSSAGKHTATRASVRTMSDFTIIVDGREQKKVAYEFDEFPVDTVRKNLDTLDSEGDYTVKGYEDKFAVERKALNDLATCCGAKREDHFEPQVQRGSKLLDEYAIVIEAPRWKAEQGMYYSNIHPNSVTGTVEKWPHKYNVEFYWNEDEHFAEVKTYQLLRHWKDMADRGLL